MKFLASIILGLGLICLASCNKKTDDHSGHDHSEGGHEDHSGHDHSEGGHDEHGHGPNGGDILKVEDKANLEIVLDEAQGKMSLYVLDKEAKKPLKVSTAPVYIVVLDGKRVSFQFKAASLPADTFTLTGDVLKAHVEGKILINLDGIETPFNVVVPHVHH
jgi:hypothetical protein